MTLSKTEVVEKVEGWEASGTVLVMAATLEVEDSLLLFKFNSWTILLRYEALSRYLLQSVPNLVCLCR